MTDQSHKIRVAGLDIGFSRTRRSAGIGLFDGAKNQLRNCFGTEACKLLADRGRYDIVAIDGPIVPVGYRRQKVRPVESLFCRGMFQKRCKPGMSHISGTGVRLRDKTCKAAKILCAHVNETDISPLFPLVRRGAIIEAFPNAFLAVCLSDKVFAGMPPLARGRKFDWLYDQWQGEELATTLPGLIADERRLFATDLSTTKHHEHRAALICVLTGLIVLRGHYTAVGNAAAGWFFLPAWSFWSDWARDAAMGEIERFAQFGVRIDLVREG
jgi:hypothetical protein